MWNRKISFPLLLLCVLLNSCSGDELTEQIPFSKYTIFRMC